LSRFGRHVSINILIGTVISVGLWSIHDNAALRDVEDAGIDWLIRMQWGVTGGEPGAAYVFLDIDEPTYRAWGEPFHVPRDRLLALIRHAVDGGAALVVVDIDLSKPGSDPRAAARLKQYLEAYTGPDRPPLLLARFFRAPLDPEGPGFYQERESFLDEAVAASPRLHWGSPLFVLDRDRLLRRWRLWEPTCRDGAPAVVPSIQLLSVALWRDPDGGADRLDEALAKLAPADCAQPMDQDSGPATLRVAGLALSTAPSGLGERILYTLPWRLGPGEAYPRTPEGSPVLAVRSARPIADEGPPVASEGLKGRVVVIGSSFADSRDLYHTPLGLMPGAMILINATRSLQTHGELEPPPWYVKLPVEILLIVLMSLVFALMSSFWGMVVSSVAVVIALLPLSFLFFRTGVWLDFAIPLMAVQVQQFAAEFKELKKGDGAPSS
jgi:hypothetical protein